MKKEVSKGEKLMEAKVGLRRKQRKKEEEKKTKIIKVKGYVRTLKSGKKVPVKGYTKKVDKIPFSQAKAHFKKQSKKTQREDLKRTAKNIVLPTKIPKSYV